MEKNIWIIANWKSNKTIKEALEWVEQVGPNLPKRDNLKVVVCADVLSLSEIKKAIDVGSYPLLIGAQNISPFPMGAHTGEESAEQLKEIVDVCLVGHSERRNQFQETDEVVSQKVEQATKASILPIVCVQDQHTAIPEGVSVVAYEPVFAIGSGTADTPANAESVAQVIKSQKDVEVLYGGSVTSENTKAFLEQQSLSGLLIGGASLDPQSFLEIVKIAVPF